MEQGKFDKRKEEEKREEERGREKEERGGGQDRPEEEKKKQQDKDRQEFSERSGHGQGQAQDTLPDSSIFTKPVHGCISNKANV
ncbi:hypothetical protein CFAM422_012967 [Trichoderma lentiforme]|uniref:Uncharacterized protein n=1 Tax=Trichoderma lentiforme TaxID=1567552 RepID=A0A9P4X403_9HYPO|nr:hypothetical protein CFAM422_012967 [Trichoderma lentiforme]